MLTQKSKIMNSDNNKHKDKTKSESLSPQAEEFPPRIEPGEYEAVCYKIETGRSWGGRTNIYIRFRIISGECEGIELFLTAPIPNKKYNHRHKYYKQWMLATCRPPHKKETLARKVFRNRLFLIKVRDTKRVDDDGKPLPDFMQYSVVHTIIKPLTGDYKL